MGAIIVLVMTNGLIRLGYGTGTNQMVLGLMLAAAVTLDIRWLKNRHKVLNEVYVAPIYHRMGADAVRRCRAPAPLRARQPPRRTPSRSALASSKGRRTSSSTATTTSIAARAMARSSASSRPDYSSSEVFAHTGGFPLGPAFDRAGNLISCVGAMGLYPIAPDARGDAALGRDAAAPGPRSSTMRGCAIPTICDIAPDGRIYFTDSTKRYDAHDWALEFDREPRHRPAAGLRPAGPARPRRCSTATATPMASAWRMTASRCSSPKAGPAASIATGSRDRRPAPPNASSGHAGLSRQHQPRLGRQLLDGLARHAHAELRPGAAPSRHAQAHDAPAAAGRMAVPQHQHRRRGEIRRDAGGSSRRSATSTGVAPSDGHLDARAQGLSLSSAASSTTASAATRSPAPTRTGPAPAPIGAARP